LTLHYSPPCHKAAVFQWSGQRACPALRSWFFRVGIADTSARCRSDLDGIQRRTVARMGKVVKARRRVMATAMEKREEDTVLSRVQVS
jgi:hypothetical protein